jgi:RHS repeat-associated protein
VITYAGFEWDPVSDGTFTYGRSPGGRVISQTDGPSTWLAGLDHHGDLSFLYTAVGVVTDTQTFDPFGDPAASTGTTGPTLGFQGDFTDPASGHVWMGTRWYDGGWASFLSRDTVFGQLRTPISLNRYTYGYANPLGYWDPDGRQGLFLEEAIDGVVARNTNITEGSGSNTQTVVESLSGQASASVSDPETVAEIDRVLEFKSTIRAILTEASSTPKTASELAARVAAQRAVSDQPRGWTAEERTMQHSYMGMVDWSNRAAFWGLDASTPEDLYLAEYDVQMRMGLATVLASTTGQWDPEHVNVGGEGCLVLCVGVSAQGGKVFIDVGSVGLGFSGGIGYATATPDEKASDPMYGGAGGYFRFWGGPIGWESGLRSGDQGWYHEPSFGFGLGARGGPGMSFKVFDVDWFFD